MVLTGLAIWGVAVTAIAAGTLWMQQRLLVDQADNELIRIANGRAGRVEMAVDLAVRQLEALAERLGSGALELAADDLLTRIVRPVLPLRQLTAIDRNGERVAHTGAPDADRDLVILPEAGGAPVLSTLVAHDGEPLLQVIVPVQEGEGARLVGWLEAHLRLSGLDDVLLDARTLGETGRVLLVGPDGQVLAPAYGGAPGQIAWPDPYAVASYVGLDGRDVIGASVTVSPTQWRLVVEKEQREAFAPASGLARGTIVVVLLVGLVGGSVAMVVSSNLVKPLDTLRHATAAVAAGRWEMQVPVERADEFGALAATFNQMAAAVSGAITREQAEKAYHAFLLNNLPLGLVACDEEMRILSVNRTGQTILAPHGGPLPGRAVADVLPAFSALTGRVEQLSINGRPIRATMAPVSTGVTTGQAGGGRGVRHLLVLEDLTEEERLRAEAKASEENAALLARILEATTDYVSMADTNKRILYINQAGRRMAGIGAHDDVTGMEISQMHPEWAYNIIRDEGLPVAARDGVWSGETAIIDADGTEMVISQVILAHKEPDGQVSLFSTIARDITDRKRMEEQLRVSEAKFAGILSIAPDAVVAVDDQQKIVLFNKSAERIFGYEAAEVLGEPLAMLLPDASRNRHEAHVQEFGASADQFRLMGERTSRAIHARRKDGELFPAEASISKLQVDGGQIYSAIVRDITDRQRTERALRESEERFRRAFEDAPIGMALVHLEGRWLKVNRALCEMLGRGQEEFMSTEVQAGMHPSDLSAYLEKVTSLLEGRETTVEVELRYFHKLGQIVWTKVSLSAVPTNCGKLDHLVAQFVDITDQKLSEARLLHLANHDALTGLLNRRGFLSRIEHHLVKVRAEAGGGAILLIDLDNFKDVNDTLGHRAGDELLTRLSMLMRETLRGVDSVARLGGDEFAFFLTDVDMQEAQIVASNLLEALRRNSVVVSGQAVGVSASCGIAMAPDHGLTPHDLMTHADLAMYRAKSSGRNTFHVYEPDPNWKEEVASRLSWEERIRAALGDGPDQFVLYAQPIIDVQTGEVVQYELLLRLLEPEGRLQNPTHFLRIAERFGLINDIDRFVVRRAIAIIADHAKAGRRLSLAVNISGKSFSDMALVSLIREEVLAAQIDPSCLILEITETAAIADLEQAKSFVTTLKALGCLFAIDDFGVGFSSLSYLKHLPIDFLKLDGSFIRNLAADQVDQHLVHSMAQLARGLHMKTVAEFVSDDETIQLLRQFGVDFAQGYHVGDPYPASEIETGLRAV